MVVRTGDGQQQRVRAGTAGELSPVPDPVTGPAVGAGPGGVPVQPLLAPTPRITVHPLCLHPFRPQFEAVRPTHTVDNDVDLEEGRLVRARGVQSEDMTWDARKRGPERIGAQHGVPHVAQGGEQVGLSRSVSSEDTDQRVHPDGSAGQSHPADGGRLGGGDQRQFLLLPQRAHVRDPEPQQHAVHLTRHSVAVGAFGIPITTPGGIWPVCWEEVEEGAEQATVRLGLEIDGRITAPW